MIAPYERLGAITIAARAGRSIQQDLPTIADEYRQGACARIIFERHPELAQRYHVANGTVGTSAVRFALTGFRGNAKVPAYTGLIPPDERQSLGRQHMVTAAKQIGLATKQNGIGVHSLSRERLVEAGRLSVAKRGFTPWIPRQFLEDRCVLSEIEVAQRMALSPDNFHTCGLGAGHPNYALIAKKLNEEYHGGKPVRDAVAVNKALFSYRHRDK